MTPLEQMQALCDELGIDGGASSRILALLDDLTPEGVVLTPAEAGLAATWAHCTVEWLGPHPTPQGAALAARLAAADQHHPHRDQEVPC